MTVEGLSKESRGDQVHHHFLYADYTPFDDKMNIIESLRDFVSFTGKIIRIDSEIKTMESILVKADILRSDFIATIKQISANKDTAVDGFYRKYPDTLATDLLTSSVALINNAKENISEILTTTQTGMNEQYEKYKDGIISRINENHRSVAAYLQDWLANDYKSFPTPLLSQLSVELNVSTDPANLKLYTISKDSMINRVSQTHRPKVGNPLQFNYVFRIDTPNLEFWSSIKRVSEFGINDVLLPLGMKSPISEKLKNAFKLGRAKDHTLPQEPEFAKVDDYYISALQLDMKRLVISLVGDVSKIDEDVFEIAYDIPTTASDDPKRHVNECISTNHFPRISYKSGRDAQTAELSDLLSVRQIAEASDLKKIMTLGTAILEKLKMLQDPTTISSRLTLEKTRISDNQIVTFSGTSKINFPILFELLNFVATTFVPFVRKLKEKTPVRGELILREESEDGQRKEFSVKIEELRSQLASSHPLGRTIRDALEL